MTTRWPATPPTFPNCCIVCARSDWCMQARWAGSGGGTCAICTDAGVWWLQFCVTVSQSCSIPRTSFSFSTTLTLPFEAFTLTITRYIRKHVYSVYIYVYIYMCIYVCVYICIYTYIWPFVGALVCASASLLLLHT